MEGKITVTRTIDDLKMAYKLYNAKHSQRSKYASWMLLVAGIVIAFSPAEGHNLSDKFLLAYIFIALGCLYIWNRYNAAQRGLKNSPDVLSEETVVITDQELQSQTSGCFMSMKWFAFVDAIVSEQMILLYVNRVNFLVYPKRFFSEAEFAFIKDKANQTIAKNESNKSHPRYRDSKP